MNRRRPANGRLGADVPARDWRAALLARLPEQAHKSRFTVNTSMMALVDLAAYNRRMRPEDYAMRAVRAFVAYDLGVNLADISEPEPEIASILAPDLKRRWRGRGFGAWRITGLEEL